MDVWNSTQALSVISSSTGEKLDEYKYRDRVEEQLHKDVEQLFATSRYELQVRGNPLSFKKQDSLIVVDAETSLPVLDGIVINPDVFSTKDFLIEDSEESKTQKHQELTQTKQKKRRTASKTSKREKQKNLNNNASSDSSESTSESSTKRSRKRTNNQNIEFDEDSTSKVPKTLHNLAVNDSDDFPIDFNNKLQPSLLPKHVIATNQTEPQPVNISHLLEDHSFSHEDLAQHLMRPLVHEQNMQQPQSPQRTSPYNVSNLDSSLFPVSMGSYGVRSPTQPSSPIQFTNGPMDEKQKWEGILRSQVPVTKTRAKWWWLLQAERNKVGEIGADSPSASMPTLPKFPKTIPPTNPTTTTTTTTTNEDIAPKLPARSKLKDLLDWVHQQNNPMALFSKSMPNLPIREKKNKNKDSSTGTEL